ncbi:hypothetical protein Q3G72_006830 [Acer saccharum]|nr:hypothetical protein Q3G72_006830 [Acer saccharum]
MVKVANSLKPKAMFSPIIAEAMAVWIAADWSRDGDLGPRGELPPLQFRHRYSVSVAATDCYSVRYSVSVAAIVPRYSVPPLLQCFRYNLVHCYSMLQYLL